MAVNLTDDLLKYDDEDIIAFLESVMASVVKNHKTALESKQPEVVWASYGDITLVRLYQLCVRRKTSMKLKN